MKAREGGWVDGCTDEWIPAQHLITRMDIINNWKNGAEERKGGIIYKWMNGQLNLEVNEGEAGINERKRWRDGNVLMVDG